MARIWDTRSGKEIGQPLLHKARIIGAHWSRDGNRVLTWSADGTARVWTLSMDLDFPSESVSLWLQALTGTEFDLVTRQVNKLSKEAWAETRRRYDRVAEAHAKTCHYREFNDWLRQHPSDPMKK